MGAKLLCLIFFGVTCFALTLLVSSHGGENIQCKTHSWAEVGRPFVLPCDAVRSSYDIYWYEGNNTSTEPILARENGIVSGSAYGKGDLELTTNGSIQIVNVEIRYEGAYTLLAFSETHESSTSTTQLMVYARPDVPCVKVDSCSSTCGECHLNVTGSGDLYCYVQNSRPNIDLRWNVINQSGIDFIKYQQETRYDEESGTYNTTTGIHYTTDGCGAVAYVYCNASLPQQFPRSILEAYNQTVLISSGKCDPSIRVWIPSTVAIVVVIVVLMVMWFICWRKGNSLPHDSIESEPAGENTEMNATGGKRDDETAKQEDDMKKELVDALLNHYEKFCYIKPSPWDEPIPIDALYTECDCSVTNGKNRPSHYTSKDLCKPKFLSENPRVLITGNLGFGKTTFTKHLVKTWVSHQMILKNKKQIKANNSVLIYLHLRGVTREAVLADVILGMLPPGNSLTRNGVEQIFQTNECHIILDGLNEISLSSKTTTSSDVSPNDSTMLTVSNLLDKLFYPNTYKKVKVWVTSRDVDDMKPEFSLPYSKVHMLGFNQQQVSEYIAKTYKYYKSKEVPERGKPGEASDISSSSHARKRNETDSDIQQSRPKKQPASDKNMKQKSKDKNETEYVLDVNNPKEKVEPTVRTKLLEDMQGDQQDSNTPLPDGKSKSETKRNKDGWPIANDDGKPLQAANTNADIKDRKLFSPLESIESCVTNFFAVHDIISNFFETPLLMILIIHIVTERELFPTGRYKGINMNQLATVVRLAINCLESRYVQMSYKNSIKDDVKTLESKLGEVAFKSKFKGTLCKPEFWNSELGEENVEAALRIGLLKNSRRIDSGGAQVEEFAFSSYSGIEFYHEVFKEYLVAQYILQSNTKFKWLDEFINGSGDEEIARILRFMFGMKHSKRLDQVFTKLLHESKMWNNLIDCIYEVSDPEMKKSMTVTFGQFANSASMDMNFNVYYLERKYHKEAVADFCRCCNEQEIKFNKMTFSESCVVEFLQDVTLPSLNFLVFFGMKIDEKQFASTVIGLCNRNCPNVLKFVSCEVPKTLRGMDLKNVRAAMKNKNMKIYMEDTSSENVELQRFDLEKRKWLPDAIPSEK